MQLLRCTKSLSTVKRPKCASEILDNISIFVCTKNVSKDFFVTKICVTMNVSQNLVSYYVCAKKINVSLYTYQGI